MLPTRQQVIYELAAALLWKCVRIYTSSVSQRKISEVVDRRLRSASTERA